MKVLHFKLEEDVTKDAYEHCLDIEAELGINLMKKHANDTNEIHGYINTSSDGTIEVCLYEDEDLEHIAKLPAHLRSHNKHRVAHINRKEAHEKCTALFVSKNKKLLPAT